MGLFRYQLFRWCSIAASTLLNRFDLCISAATFGSKFFSAGKILICNYAGRDGLILGNNVFINSSISADPIGGQERTILWIGKEGRLHIGNRVGISNSAIAAAKEIIIEDDVCIGAGCRIYDTDFHSEIAQYRLNGNTHIPSSPVRICTRAFIGGHSIILKGVTIGEESVVGAGSVVTQNVPARQIWAGNPAIYIRDVRTAETMNGVGKK